MKVIQGEEIKKIKFNNTAVALGSFDALHKGHMEIICQTTEYAKKNSLTPVVLILQAQDTKRYVNTFEKRMQILESAGVEIVVVQKLDDNIRKIKYADFVRDYLYKMLDARFVCAGFNYHFGYMAQGDAKQLEMECAKYGIKTYIQSCIELEHIVSSTYVRKLIELGKMSDVQRYLGRRFSIGGTVVSGKQIGRTIGFPTVNINMPEDLVVPMPGVYVTACIYNGNRYRAITNVGHKPTVDEEKSNIETHIFDFDKEIYGEKVEIVFYKKIRDIVKFNSLDDLEAQLTKDKKFAIDYMKNLA